MKWLIYLLLLANLGMFVWHYQDEDSAGSNSAGEAQTDSSGTLSLVLLREQQERAQSPQIESGRKCNSLGPFDSRGDAEVVARILARDGIEAQTHLRKDAKRKAYWVLLPPAESRKAARESLARLKKLNVTDYFLVVSGEQENAISLGVFSRFESAHRRIKQMQELGFKPRFEKVDLPKKEFWLEWPDTGVAADEDLLARIREKNAEVAVLKRVCSEK